MKYIQQKLDKIGLFLPISTKIICWNFFTLTFVLIEYVNTIIASCFKHQPSRILLVDVINFILPFILLADILIEFNTGFIKNGKIITQRKAANQQYIRSIYFYSDIISLFMSMFQLIYTATVPPHEITVVNYIVFIKLIKVNFLDSIMKKYVIKSNSLILYYQTAKNFIILVLLCHTIGSLYFLLSSYLYQNNYYGQSQVWVFTSSAMNNIYNQSFQVKYTYSFYVAIVTLSGTCYGDILPLNPIQTLFIFLCFILPMLIYAYAFQSIFYAIINRSNSIMKIRKYKILTKQYLKSLGVNYKVINKIITYLQFTFKKDMIIDTSFINQLAPTIKKQYIKSIIQGKFHFDCFNQILNIAKIDTIYLKDLIYDIIIQEYFPQRTTLITPDKIKLYYINKGIVNQIVKLNPLKKLSKPLKKNNFVGKTIFFTNQVPKQKKFAYQTETFVTCHSVDQKAFKNKIKSKFTILNQAYCYLQNQIIDQKCYQKMMQKCYFCDQIKHPLQECPYLKLDKIKIFQQKNSQEQNRKYISRDSSKKIVQSLIQKFKNNSLVIKKAINNYIQLLLFQILSVLTIIISQNHIRFMNRIVKKYKQQLKILYWINNYMIIKIQNKKAIHNKPIKYKLLITQSKLSFNIVQQQNKTIFYVKILKRSVFLINSIINGILFEIIKINFNIVILNQFIKIL